MSYLVYTGVFGGYDRVFPPCKPEPDTTYLLVTDDPHLKVEGWQTLAVDTSRFKSTSLANRYYKMLMHRVVPDFKVSLYVDGNIRVIGPVSEVFARFEEADTDLKLFSHPDRDTVEQEVMRCIKRGQVRDPDSAFRELAQYRADGFTDDNGLIEATILLKRHDRPALGPAMQLWWECYSMHSNRDQFSLPYVLWKTSISYSLHDFNFREPNPWFGLYPHRGDPAVNSLYADIYARSYDSAAHRGVLALWHASWAVRRALRGKGARG